jgi:hypothetical protein
MMVEAAVRVEHATDQEVIPPISTSNRTRSSTVRAAFLAATNGWVGATPEPAGSRVLPADHAALHPSKTSNWQEVWQLHDPPREPAVDTDRQTS